MPTGYTSKLYEGTPQTFQEFALSCARAFGALIEMRDDPMDAPIPDEFTASDRHERELAKAQERLRVAQAMSDKEATAKAEAHNAKALRAHEEIVKTSRAMRLRYETMLAQVERWQPPTEEHVSYKQFMVDQLKESIRFDCSDRDAPLPMTGADYRAHEIERAKWSIDYHTKEAAGERDRAAGRTAWVRALKASLSGRYDPVGAQ